MAEANAGTHSKAFDAMMERWSLLVALSGGTKAMRDGRDRWLPLEEEETQSAYEARIGRSFLFEGFHDTVVKLAAKPFTRDITLKGDEALSEQLQLIRNDADFQGTNLTQFARQLLDDMIRYGKCHCLVDFPSRTDPTTGEITGFNLRQERESGVHPYFVRIPPHDLIAWQSEMVNGEHFLTQARWKETRIEADGEWGEREVELVRVFTPTEWSLYQKSDDDEWAQVGGAPHTFGAVPLVTAYAKRTGFMTADPPLEGLAWYNLAHWQSNSDQRNLLRIARVGILYLFGITEEEYEDKLTIGPSNFVRSVNPDAKMGYAEHSGSAINSGRQDLLDLQDAMEILGLQPFIRKTGTTTAYERAENASKTESNLQSWIRALEAMILDAYGSAAKWIGAELPGDFAVDIFNDFGVPLRAEGDLKVLQILRSTGNISQETFLREVKRRGVLSDDLDIEEEIASVEMEAASVSVLDEDEA